MSTEADPVRTARHVWLLAPLLLLAAGPAVADSLPHGPRSLLVPGPALIGAAAVVLLWTVFAWPALLGRRRCWEVVGSALLIGVLAGPFLVGLARLAGTGTGDLLGVAGVLAAWLLATGIYLVGPGRERKWDRWFAASAILVLFAAPLVNYALNEFARVTGDVGYRISPILTVRRIVLGLPDADPSPFYWLCLAAVAGLSGPRLLRRAAPFAGLLLLAAVVRGDTPEVKPVFGRYFVPDRPIPLLVTGGKPGEWTWLRVPGRGRYGGGTSSRGCYLTVPLPRSPQGMEVRFGMEGEWLPVEVDLEPVLPGQFWVVCVREVPESLLGEPRIAAGLVAPPESLSSPFAWIEPDAFVDRFREALNHPPRGKPVFHELPPSVTEALLEVHSPLRRIWEEGRDLVSLRRLFEADTRSGDDDAPWTAFALLAGFTVAAAGAVRFLRRSKLLIPCLLVLASGASLAILSACPRPPDFETWSIVVDDGSRGWEIRRIRAARDVIFHEGQIALPVVLGEGAEAEVVCHWSGLALSLDLPLRAHETRYLISEVGPPDVLMEPELVIGPDGLSVTGGEAMWPTEFLVGAYAERFSETTPAGVAVRKLLRLGREDLPRYRYGVGIEVAEGRPVHVRIFRPGE